MRKSDTGKNYAALFDVDSERIIADMEQYAADLVELIFNEAVSGYSADDILDTIVLQKKQVQKPEVLFERLKTWQLVFECIMTLRLPMLHGYSRMEYERVTGKNAFDTGGCSRQGKR